MSQLQKSVQTGIELASKAIAFDSNHQYQEAIQEYNAAIDVFGDVVQDPECSEQKRTIVSQKIQEYQARVILLLDALSEVPAEEEQQQRLTTSGDAHQVHHQEPAPQIIHSQAGGQPLVHQPSSVQQSPHQQHAPGTAFLVTPTGPVPLTPELAVQLALDPLLVEYAQRHPKELPNLSVALTLAEKAKEADVRHAWQQALDLYVEVLERFTLAASHEKNPSVQVTLLSTINAYKDRAEKIKTTFNLLPRIVYVPASNLGKDSISNLPIVPSNIRRVSGEITSGGLGSPLTVKKTTKILGLRAGTLALEVTIKRNVVNRGDQVSIGVFVDNRSGSVVNCMKVKLVRVVGSKTKKDWKKTIVSRQEYFQGSIFPLQAENSYRGDLTFPIPTQGLFVSHTACSFYLVVECELSLTKNLKAKLPVIIAQ